MCERLEKIEKLTETVKIEAEKAVEAAKRLCEVVNKSNGKIPEAFREVRNARRV